MQVLEYGTTLLCYCLCWFLSVSPFVLFYAICFTSDPWFIRQLPCFLGQLSHYYLLCVVLCVQCTKGRGVSHGWRGGVLGSARKFKLAMDLMCQPNSWVQFPVYLPVPQGTVYTSSTYHTWVLSCNGNWKLTVYPVVYVWNGFVHFFWHGLTQLH